MHISKDQFGNIKHMLEDRFGDNLKTDTSPHYRYDEKARDGIENGTIYSYFFEKDGKNLKLDVIEQQKVAEKEKIKDGKVVGRHFDTIAGEYTYSMDLFIEEDDDWKKVDLENAYFLF